MKKLKMPVFLPALFFLFSCGIQEYYYLPQVPESNIFDKNLSNRATIRIPSISQYYYATNYSIFYRIYISGETPQSVDTTNMNSLNPELARDYNSLLRYTQTDGTTMTTKDTFPNLKYYEIKLDGKEAADVFSKNGGTLEILFPATTGSYPTVSLNNGDEIRLRRTIMEEGNTLVPENDLFFRNTPELNDYANATAEKNIDVSGRSGLSQRYAYVSMYIVAIGYNNENFSPIFSKPTHILVFRLPDIY